MDKFENQGGKKNPPLVVSGSWVQPWLEQVRTEHQKVFNAPVSTLAVCHGQHAQES